MSRLLFKNANIFFTIDAIEGPEKKREMLETALKAVLNIRCYTIVSSVWTGTSMNFSLNVDSSYYGQTMDNGKELLEVIRNTIYDLFEDILCDDIQIKVNGELSYDL